MFRGGLLLFDKGHASPLQLAAYLGRAQRFDLLNRPTLAAFDKVYDFVHMTDDKVMAPLGETVLGEIALSLLLSPFWEVDATREWSTCLGASDASTDFGFGVCAAAVSPALSRRIGRAADRGHHHIRLLRSADPSYKREERKGKALHIPVRHSDFKQNLSVRSKFRNNIVALEGDASLLLVRWICRSTKNHGKRTPVLIDAQSLLGALAKGRSSSGSLKVTVRRVAAHHLASDIALKPIYAPSEDNPADEGSRGTPVC